MNRSEAGADGVTVYEIACGSDLVGSVVDVRDGVEVNVGHVRTTADSLDEALARFPALTTVNLDTGWRIESDMLPAWRIAARLTGDAPEVEINGTTWSEHYDSDIAWVPEDPDEQEDSIPGVSIGYTLSEGAGSPGGSPAIGESLTGVGDLRYYTCYEFDQYEWFRVMPPISERGELLARGPGSEYLHEIDDPSLGVLDSEKVNDLLGAPEDYIWRPITVNGVDWISRGETWVRDV